MSSDNLELDRQVVNNIVGTIVLYLNNGTLENLSKKPESYGAVLTWTPGLIKTLYFNYWQYGVFKYSIDGGKVREMLPTEMKCLVDCIRSFGVEF